MAPRKAQFLQLPVVFESPHPVVYRHFPRLRRGRLIIDDGVRSGRQRDRPARCCIVTRR
jgi:hypothetical protein